MSAHTLAIVVGVLYAAQLAARLVTPVPPKQPWTFERVFETVLRLSLNVFVVWLLLTVVF